MAQSNLKILQLNSARKYVGEAAHTLNLTEALRGAGHSVWLGLRKGFHTYEMAEGRSLDPIAFNMLHRWWPPGDLPDLKLIARLVRKEKIDVIHAHRGKDHWQAVLAVKLFGLNVPVVRTRHVVTPLKKHVSNQWQAKQTACLIAVSRAIESDVQSTEMYPEGKVVLIPGGIDTKKFNIGNRREEVRKRLDLSPDALVAVCVARFAVVKAHRVLIEAWKDVHTQLPNAVLLLVGGGRLDEEVRAQVAKLNLEGPIRILGRAEPDEIPEMLEASDVGTLASVGSEGFSRAVLEYMAVGLPVVATSVGAIPDLVSEGVTGSIVAPEDPKALGHALVDVLRASADQRSSWGQAARVKVEQDHDYPAWAKAHGEIYRKSLGE